MAPKIEEQIATCTSFLLPVMECHHWSSCTLWMLINSRAGSKKESPHVDATSAVMVLTQDWWGRWEKYLCSAKFAHFGSELVFSRFHSSTSSPVLTCHGWFFLNLRFYRKNREGSWELILDWSAAYVPCWYDAEMLCVKIYEGYLCFNNSSNHLGT